MATDELNHNHPVALSCGICADSEINGGAEHLYEVVIEQETVAHYTPDGRSFENTDSPTDITDREPNETYSLNGDEDGGLTKGGEYER
jgi:hypothetical protein